MAKDILSKNINIGVDIEDIDRFNGLDRVRDKNFLGKIFTEKELKYCFSKKNGAESLAARFSAKEAVLKALGGKGLSFTDLEISNNVRGEPEVSFVGSVFEKYFIKISMSHCKDKAIAVALVLKNFHER